MKKKVFGLSLFLTLVFSISVVSFASSTLDEDFARMGLKVTGGNTLTVSNESFDLSKAEVCPQSGWLMAPDGNTTVIEMLRISRLSEDIQVNITEDNIILIKDFVQNNITNGIPVSADMYVTNAIKAFKSNYSLTETYNNRWRPPTHRPFRSTIPPLARIIDSTQTLLCSDWVYYEFFVTGRVSVGYIILPANRFFIANWYEDQFAIGSFWGLTGTNFKIRNERHHNFAFVDGFYQIVHQPW